ncbi:chaperone protein dnaJ 11, chloroplastic-like [Pyrus communis]|uniref:chaperone protein dnaJ 11, chloroplastic-like n=1 Tax=Pyrus communis TaxID=23211 RepID=UPI0035C00E24
MASISSSSFTCSSSPFFSVVNGGPRAPPSSVSYRVSASCSSTVDKPRSRIGSSSSLYEVLGIHAGATCHEIKSAYRKLARVVHPDVAKSSADEFMKVHEAYSTLSDAQKRADYDRKMLIGRPRTGVASSYAYATTMSTGRRWETDQCW